MDAVKMLPTAEWKRIVKPLVKKEHSSYCVQHCIEPCGEKMHKNINIYIQYVYGIYNYIFLNELICKYI